MVKTVFKTRSKVHQTFSVELAAGETIFAEGDLGLEMYIVQSGSVDILKRFKDEERQLARLGQGDFFGEMSILEDLPRTATARAATDCVLLRIDGSTFDQMLRKNPEIAVRMMRKLSRRLRETDQLLREAMGTDESHAPEMPTQQPEAPDSGPAEPERLFHPDSGTDLHLAEGPETTVGRKDPVTGILPDVDLTDLDTQRSISRRHAKIFRQDGKFYVREEIGTMNGTFVNGTRIETGVPVEFREGDEVRFGLVRTVFKSK